MTFAKVTLFGESGKYCTTEDWRIPENAITPYDMIRSEDFRRIANGAVLVETQAPWGYPCLFPTGMEPPVLELRYMDLDDGSNNVAAQPSAIEPPSPAPEWVAAEWQYVMVGDHVRMGAQEADVTYASVQKFHVHEGEWEWSEREQRNVRPVTKWEHKECGFKVAHLGDELLPIPPGSLVEILMGRERQSIYLLQSMMDATVVQ